MFWGVTYKAQPGPARGRQARGPRGHATAADHGPAWPSPPAGAMPKCPSPSWLGPQPGLHLAGARARAGRLAGTRARVGWLPGRLFRPSKPKPRLALSEFKRSCLMNTVLNAMCSKPSMSQCPSDLIGGWWVVMHANNLALGLQVMISCYRCFHRVVGFMGPVDALF